MKMFDNLESKLEEIRTNDYYKPYINEFKNLYDKDKENPILPLSYKTFMTFVEKGSRTESEKPYFHKRRRLGYLTMLALIYPEEKKYIDDICEVVWSICSEISWVIAAHLHCNLTEHKSIIDLFAAETGLYLQWKTPQIGGKALIQIGRLFAAEVLVWHICILPRNALIL